MPGILDFFGENKTNKFFKSTLPSSDLPTASSADQKKALLGAAKGLTTDLVGAPVDIINMVLKAGGLDIKKPVGGSDWIKDVIGVDRSGEGSKSEMLGNLATGLLNPAHAIAGIGGMIVDAKKVVTAGGLRAARTMQEAGADADKITAATGLHTGTTDGRLKGVISDAQAAFKPGKVQELARSAADDMFNLPTKAGLSELPPEGKILLGDLIDHPKLFKAYPELAKIKVDTRADYGGGAFYGGYNEISLGNSDGIESLMSVLLHETQHAIQHKEGFSKGGNAGMFLPKDFNSTATKLFTKQSEYQAELYKKYPNFNAFNSTETNLAKNPGMATDELYTKYREAADAYAETHVTKAEAYKSYENIAGEAEARVVQFMRTNPTATVPEAYKSIGVDRSKLIPSPQDAKSNSSQESVLDFFN